MLPGGWYDVRLRRRRRSWTWTIAERQANGPWVTIAAGAAATRDEAAQHGLAAAIARGRVVVDDDAAADGAARC